MSHIVHSFHAVRPAFLLAALALFFMPINSLAQNNSIPGKWIRVAVPTAPEDFGFFDSLNGIGYGPDIFVNNIFSFTSNGGKSWDTIGQENNGIWEQPFIHAVSSTAPLHGIAAQTDCEMVELDGDSINLTDCPEDAPPDFQTYTPFAQKMYDTNYGFRFVQVLTHGTVYAESYIAVTHDDWRTYQSFGDSLNGTELSLRTGGGIMSEITGAHFVDSNEVWVAVQNAIYRTTNAGAHWDTIYPLSGTSDSSIDPAFDDIIVNPSTREVYAVSSVAPIDFVYSSDYGATWKIDSAFKGKMLRMYVPAPHVLWAAISPRPVGGQVSLDWEYNYTPEYEVRNLAYSSNNGASWTVDSTTFYTDSTMIEMYWLDARHGWISTIIPEYPPDTDTRQHYFVWYYDPDGNSNVQTYAYGTKYGQVHLYPNPATNVIFTEETLDGAMQIYDPLGRRYLVPQTTSSFDISNLPNGVYFLYDGVAVRGKFLKQ